MSEPPSTRLGFGVSGPLGQFWFGAAATSALIEQAIAGGVAHFDTAPFYFDAERRLGETLKRLGATGVFVSTKTGTRREGRRLVKDFSEAAIRRDVDESRRRLHRDSLDLLYLHGPTREQVDECLPALNCLKKEGAVKAIGVCGAGEPLRRAAAVGYDAVMAAYNVIDRDHGAIFADARRGGVLTIAVAPLAQGLFDPEFHFPRSPSDLWRIARVRFRGRYPAEVVAAARQALGPDDPAGRALGFVLADPAVDIVLTTTTKPRHLAASLTARPLSQAEYASLASIALDRRTDGP